MKEESDYEKYNQKISILRFMYRPRRITSNAFHVIPNGGSVFLPMHIPVLICGLFCGAPYGLACGIITPFFQV